MMKGSRDRWKKAAMVACGLGIGAVNGLLGGGGGMLTVPVLQRWGGLDTRKAHATAIAVMLPLCVVSAVVYSVRGVYDLRLGWVSAVAVTLGGAAGAVLLGKLPKEVASLVFYALMLAGGVQSVVRCLS